MEIESATFHLFPDMPIADWVHLWKCGYSEEYGGGPDVEYASLMNSVHSATDFSSTVGALENFFGWKDRLKNRWIPLLHSITSEQWEQLKSQQEIPAFWANEVVYNVFL